MKVRVDLSVTLLIVGCVVAVHGNPIEVASDGKPVVPLLKECSKYRTLLSLDGGGMRGIVTTQALRTLVIAIKEHLLDNQEILRKVNSSFRFVTKEDFHVDLADYFDAIAGISAGSWMASYVASKGGAHKESGEIFKMEHIKRRFGVVRPGSIKGLAVFFMEYGVYIYPPQAMPFVMKPRFWGAPIPKIDYFTVPAYKPTGLEWTLNKFLGDTLLSEVSTSLLIAAFDLNIRSAVQFVYDNIKDIPSREHLRSIEQKTEKLRDCIERIYTASGSKESLPEKLVEIETDCDKAKDISKEMRDVNENADENKRGTVRTGYVWTRTIARDFKSDEDYEEPGMQYYSDMDYYLRDLTRASSAFPMLHGAKNIKPQFDIRNEYDLIDGAMVGNNPTLQALIWMSSSPNVNITDIAVISIGTGTAIPDLMSLGQGGFVQWTLPIMGLLLDSSSEFVQSNIDYLYYMTMQTLVLPNQYLRIQVAAKRESAEGRALSSTDDVTLLRELQEIGMKNALRYKANIEHFVKNFMFARCTNPKFKLIDRVKMKRKADEHDQVKADYEQALKDAEAPLPSATVAAIEQAGSTAYAAEPSSEAEAIPPEVEFPGQPSAS